jgi:phospholipid transport system substrate-binding protein
MNACFRSLALLSMLALPLLARAAPADDAITKPVKIVVQSVRLSKDELALKHFAADEQGRFLLGESWDQGTDAQRKEFTTLFKRLFSLIAFPKVRDNFKNLISITYDAPKLEGSKATVSSIVLIDHPMKKQELKLVYSVLQEKEGWKVLDVKVLGDSMLTGIRDDQVQPILKQGGWDRLLELMRAKNAELSAQAKSK